MSEAASPPRDAVGRTLGRLSNALAGFGGVVLLGVMMTVVVSVVGRTVFGRPILGDFEIVELGSAIGVFAFLPYCQMRGGNVLVDFFTHRSPPRVKGMLDAAGNLIFAAIAALLCWRLALGGLDLHRYHEVSMVLRVPIWWTFLFIVPSMALLTAVCAYTAWRSLAGARGGGAEAA